MCVPRLALQLLLLLKPPLVSLREPPHHVRALLEQPSRVLALSAIGNGEARSPAIGNEGGQVAGHRRAGQREREQSRRSRAGGGGGAGLSSPSLGPPLASRPHCPATPRRQRPIAPRRPPRTSAAAAARS
eukprot:337505-Prymnesium_polylepis.1